jgi:hypothetical protein
MEGRTADIVTYAEFKQVESNLRSAFDTLRALAQHVRDVNAMVQRQTELLGGMQLRLSRLEDRVYGKGGTDATS